MKNFPATTTVTTILAATTAPAASATSSTQTTGPAEVGPSVILCFAMMCHMFQEDQLRYRPIVHTMKK